MSTRRRVSQILLSCGFRNQTTLAMAQALAQEAYARSNKFPEFSDGDVTIVLSGGRVYRLHAGVLRRNSEYFTKALAEDKGALLTSRAKNAGATTRYRLDLAVIESGYGFFVPREVYSARRSHGTSTLLDIENGKVPNEAYKHYDNLFRAFYNLQLKFDTKNLPTVLRDTMGLVEVAEFYGAINSLAESVDVALLRQGQILYKSIARNPIAWSKFSCRIQSPTIFKDSLIHLVGQWAMLAEEERAELTPVVVEICERRYKYQSSMKQAIELRILGHYPVSMQRTEQDQHGRATYSNNIYSWMAISLFRQWFGQNIVDKKTSTAADGGASIYRQIARGGQAYLTRAQVADFYLSFPMTRKGRTVFESHLTAYKEEIQAFVQPLMVNNTQLEQAADDPLDYLLCLEVKDNDYPWVPETESVEEDELSD